MCNRFPTPVCILSYVQSLYYPLIWQLHSDFGDFNTGVYHVTKITIAESLPDMILLQPTCYFIPDVLATVNKMSVMIVSIGSARGLRLEVTFFKIVSLYFSDVD